MSWLNQEYLHEPFFVTVISSTDIVHFFLTIYCNHYKSENAWGQNKLKTVEDHTKYTFNIDERVKNNNLELLHMR